MQDLKNKIAVITGAASGFGRELAILCAAEGMKLALCDLDEKNLAATKDLLPPDIETLLMSCNVARANDVEQVAVKTYEQFGAAHLLFNNAGVAVAGPTWTTTLQDWEWVLGVNLMGVVHGIRSFVPRMIEQKQPAHVVNTASVAGLTSPPASSVYCVSKHGVVTLSECMHHELQLMQIPIGVSVLCPAFVTTGIADAGRSRPAELAESNPLAKPFEDRVREATRRGKLSAADVAKITIDAVKRGDFYILTHPKIKGTIEMRMRDILDGRLPSNPMP